MTAPRACPLRWGSCCLVALVPSTSNDVAREMTLRRRPLMPGKYLDYYTRVADRILPYVQGRRVAVEQRFSGSDRIVYRRHTGKSGDDTWIRAGNREGLLALANSYAEGIHAN